MSYIFRKHLTSELNSPGFMRVVDIQANRISRIIFAIYLNLMFDYVEVRRGA
jgi:hypothetical protein